MWQKTHGVYPDKDNADKDSEEDPASPSTCIKTVVEIGSEDCGEDHGLTEDTDKHQVV